MNVSLPNRGGLIYVSGVAAHVRELVAEFTEVSRRHAAIQSTSNVGLVEQ